MKRRKLLLAGLCGTLCLSFGVVAYAQIQNVSAAPESADVADIETEAGDFFYRGENGGEVSEDGKTWLSQSDYEKNNETPQVEYWTVPEYEKWISKEKKELETLIGSGDGWYDGQGTFHEWTRESVDEVLDEYYKTLESMKKGVLYSKDSGDGDTFAMIPPTDDTACDYSVDVVKENGESIHIGNYSTEEELEQEIEKAVKKGTITKEEAKAAHMQ